MQTISTIKFQIKKKKQSPIQHKIQKITPIFKSHIKNERQKFCFCIHPSSSNSLLRSLTRVKRVHYSPSQSKHSPLQIFRNLPKIPQSLILQQSWPQKDQTIIQSQPHQFLRLFNNPNLSSSFQPIPHSLQLRRRLINFPTFISLRIGFDHYFLFSSFHYSAELKTETGLSLLVFSDRDRFELVYSFHWLKSVSRFVSSLIPVKRISSCYYNGSCFIYAEFSFIW